MKSLKTQFKCTAVKMSWLNGQIIDVFFMSKWLFFTVAFMVQNKLYSAGCNSYTIWSLSIKITSLLKHTHTYRESMYTYVCVKLVKLDCLSALMHAVIKVKQMECCHSSSCLMNVCTLFLNQQHNLFWFFQLKRSIHAECHWGPHSVSVCICHLVAVKLLHCSFFNQTWKRTKGNNFPAKISQRSSRGGWWLTGP